VKDVVPGLMLWLVSLSLFVIFLLTVVVVIQYRIDSIEEGINDNHRQTTIEAQR
jgi:hypothetical protein